MRWVFELQWSYRSGVDNIIPVKNPARALGVTRNRRQERTSGARCSQRLFSGAFDGGFFVGRRDFEND